MITQSYVEHDGDRVLWRIAVDDAATLDVLTDLAQLRRVRAALEDKSHEVSMAERLGSFGPFQVTVSVSAGNPDQAFVSVDGPDVGNAFKGDQSIVFYFSKLDLIAALTVK